MEICKQYQQCVVDCGGVGQEIVVVIEMNECLDECFVDGGEGGELGKLVFVYQWDQFVVEKIDDEQVVELEQDIVVQKRVCEKGLELVVFDFVDGELGELVEMCGFKCMFENVLDQEVGG